MKICNKCTQEKDENEFYKSQPNKCKKCCIESQRTYRKANPIKSRESVRRWRKKNPETCKEQYTRYNKKRHDKARIYNRERNYGLLNEDYCKLLELQNGVCAICGKLETQLYRGIPRSLCVDHDHETGEVRGLLCNSCNNLIGRSKESPITLQKAIEYLSGIYPSLLLEKREYGD